MPLQGSCEGPHAARTRGKGRFPWEDKGSVKLGGSPHLRGPAQLCWGVLGTSVSHACLPQAAPHFSSLLRGSLASRGLRLPLKKALGGYPADVPEKEALLRQGTRMVKGKAVSQYPREAHSTTFMFFLKMFYFFFPSVEIKPICRPEYQKKAT